MANPLDHKYGDVPAQRSKTPLNWGWVALGGCFGLVVALIVVLFPIIAMMIGMGVSSIQEEEERQRRLERTPELSEQVCHEAASAVVARIEAGLTIRGGRLRWARAVHSAEDAEQWWVAAEVQGVGYEGDHDIAVWLLTTRDGLADDDALATENLLAVEVSNFPLVFGRRPDLEDAVEACVGEALTGR